jgi:hypothetical protein
MKHCFVQSYLFLILIPILSAFMFLENHSCFKGMAMMMILL